MLLLHGFPDRADLWRHQIDALKSDFTVIAPDLRGFGDSDTPDDVDAYRVGKSVGDVVAILDELGIEQTHVVGHDFGAAVAWAFALSVPERLDRLVVLSVGHPGVPTDFAQREKSWYMLLFQFAEAEELVTTGILAARETQVPYDEALLMRVLSRVRRHQGDDTGALRDWVDAEQILESLGASTMTAAGTDVEAAATP